TALYSGDNAGFVYEWNLVESPPKRKATIADRLGNVWGLDYHPNLAILAMGGESVVIRDLTASNPTNQTLPLKAEQGMVLRLAFSPNGAWLAAATDKDQVIVWDTKTWTEQPLKLQGISSDASKPQVRSLAWSHDSLRLAAGSFQSIQVWSCPVP
ncbi:MAG: hypothetical protein H6727_13865, partial [Myxococcales bacterium]|nr:hypothetical protein [Myxococcales bacterium]